MGSWQSGNATVLKTDDTVKIVRGFDSLTLRLVRVLLKELIYENE